MTKDQKEYVDHVIQIFLNGLTCISNDAGWHGCGLMGRIIDFCGDLPAPTGYDQSNMTQINEIEYLRKIHAELPMIRAVIAVMLRDNRKHQAVAILARHYYVGVYQDTDRAWTDTERSRQVDQNLREFQYNVSKAYYSILREIVLARHYKLSA